MASISPDARGYQRIFFLDKHGKRLCLRLGKLPEQRVDAIAVKVEELNAAAKAGGSLDNDTSQWLAQIGDALYAKLAALGLVKPRGQARLGDFLAGYIAGRKDIKARTRLNLDACRRRLIEHFGADRDLRSITPGDADGWLVFLREKDYAGATIGRTVKRARQFFRHAVRKRLLPENPFQDLKAPSQSNDARKHFVPLEVVNRLLEACPDGDWRLILALCRFGGLRCPSELLCLKWSDMDWERSRFLVHSPKNEHLEDGGDRWVPMFPELRPYLDAGFELAKPGAVHVITRYRSGDANLRTQFERIIKKAGVLPWPRLFHNLRGSRETELAGQFPIHVVCAWIGNTELIAAKHYLHVTDADFAQAVTPPAAQCRAQRRTHAAATNAQRSAAKKKTPEKPGLSCTQPQGVARMESRIAAGYPQGDNEQPQETQDFPLFSVGVSQCQGDPVSLRQGAIQGLLFPLSEEDRKRVLAPFLDVYLPESETATEQLETPQATLRATEGASPRASRTANRSSRTA